ncbi:hypothetical protein D3C79_876020 [compost metagenome]
MARITGAFHGAIPSTTPQGARTAMATLPGTSEGMTSPQICVVIAAASRSIPAARRTLKAYQLAMAPVSPAASRNSPLRACIRSAAASKRLRRSLGASADQAGNAACAAATAASASARLAAATCETTSPLNGLRRSKVFPSLAGHDRPPISKGTCNIVIPL